MSTPPLDRWVARRVGFVLAWLGRRALDRGDRHEFEHMRAAVTAGNSVPCDRAGRCHLQHDLEETA